MDWEIFTYGNGDFLRQVFNALAMIFGSDNYLTAIKLSALLGFIGVLIRAAFDRNVLESFRWFLAMLVFCWVVLVPKSTVIITDRVNMADSSVVDNVPFGLAATAGMFSALGNALTEMTETVFNLPNTLRYQDSGLLSAHRMYDALSNMGIADARTNANYAEFLSTCVIFDGIGQRRFTWEDVLASNDLADFFSTRVAANVARFRYRDATGSDQIVPCRSGFAEQLLADISSSDSIDAIMHTGITPLVSRFGDEAAAIQQFRTQVNASFNFLLGVSDTVDDMVVQAALVNGLAGGLSRIAQETGATEFNAAMIGDMQNHQMTNQGTLTTLAKDKLPLMHAVFEAFLYAVFPLMVLLAIITPARSSLNYAKLLLWINLWAPLFAILNFAVNYWDRASLSSLAVGGITAGNMSTIASYVVDASATAMLIGTMLPVLAWFLVTGAGGMLVGIAGGILRNAAPRHGRATEQAQMSRYSSSSLSPPLGSALHVPSATLSGAGRPLQARSANEAPSSALQTPAHRHEQTGANAAPGNHSLSSSPRLAQVQYNDPLSGGINGKWVASINGAGSDSGDLSEAQLRAERAWAEQRLQDVEAISNAASRELASLDSAGLPRLSSASTVAQVLPPVIRREPEVLQPPTPILQSPENQQSEPAAVLPPPAATENVEATVAELLQRVRFGMMGNADVKQLQQLIGMEERYQTGNYRELTRAAVQQWREERGMVGAPRSSEPNHSQDSDIFVRHRGAAYRQSQIKSWSHYNEPIDYSAKGPRGFSRIHGDASIETQQAAIDSLISSAKQKNMPLEHTAIVLTFARIESGFNPDAASNQSAAGLLQFLNKTGEAYGLNSLNRWDIDAQARAAVEFTAHNIDQATRHIKSIGESDSVTPDSLAKYAYILHHDGNFKAYTGGRQVADKAVVPKLNTYINYLKEIGYENK